MKTTEAAAAAAAAATPIKNIIHHTKYWKLH